MKKITVTVDGTGAVSLDGSDAGYYGEHLATCLEITPAVTFSENCEYYKMNVDGYVSGRLTPTDGKITYTLPGSALRPPSISCQLIGYKLVDSIPVMVIRSAVFTLNVEVSPAGEPPEIINGSLQPLETALAECGNTLAAAEKLLDEITDAQVTTRTELKNLKDSAASASSNAASAAASAAAAAASAETVTPNNYYKKTETYSKTDADKQLAARSSKNSSNPSSVTYSRALWVKQDDTGENGAALLYDNYPESPFALWSSKKTMETVRGETRLLSNALKGSKTGGAVQIDDASPTSNGLNVTLTSKNLIPYPYAQSTLTENGITFTVGTDGSVTANGTATADTLFFLTRIASYTVPKGSYTLSGCPAGGSGSTYALILGSSDYKDIGSGVSRTYKSDENQNIFIKIYSGYTANNLVFKPQLEIGASATAYTPYVSDFSSKTVIAYGKNLTPYPYYEKTKTVSGVTYTVNSTGTITAKGTATETATFMCSILSAFFLPKGNYILTSGISNDDTVRTFGITFGYKYGSNSRAILGTKDGKLQIALTEDAMCDIVLVVRSGQEVNLEFKPQLELGSTATAYENPKAPSTHASAADGTVAGITLDTGVSTIVPDEGGLVLNCGYNRDINKAFEKLKQAIISLGGNL